MDAAPVRIEIYPNCSLNLRGAATCFAAVCIIPCSVAGFLAVRGFWPVLPFVAAELALLAWALKVSLERRFLGQTITVTAAEVSIESRERERCARVVFPRHWAQVKLRLPAAQPHPPLAPLTSICPHDRRNIWVD